MRFLLYMLSIVPSYAFYAHTATLTHLVPFPLWSYRRATKARLRAAVSIPQLVDLDLSRRRAPATHIDLDATVLVDPGDGPHGLDQ